MARTSSLDTDIMATSKAITCYGNDDDRLKAAAIAMHHNLSQSEWILKQIRSEYTRLFGDLPPGDIKCVSSPS